MTKSHNQGSNNSTVPLSDQQIKEIRREYKVGGTSQRLLAKKHRVSRPTINDIVNRKTWKHLRD